MFARSPTVSRMTTARPGRLINVGLRFRVIESCSPWGPPAVLCADSPRPRRRRRRPCVVTGRKADCVRLPQARLRFPRDLGRRRRRQPAAASSRGSPQSARCPPGLPTVAASPSRATCTVAISRSIRSDVTAAACGAKRNLQSTPSTPPGRRTARKSPSRATARSGRSTAPGTSARSRREGMTRTPRGGRFHRIRLGC